MIYAGSPGKKDALHLVVEGVTLVPPEVRDRFEFRIIGATKEQFIEQNGEKNIPGNIAFLGSVPREQVIEELQRADFTTFLRDSNLRFVNAGFPSKLAESMSMGVPVITNLTSDLAIYLRNGDNCIIVEEFSGMAYAKALCVVATLENDKLVSMHESSKETARNSFDFSNYVEDIEYLIVGEKQKYDIAWNI